MRRGPQPKPMLIGHRAAIFGLLLAGQSTFTIGNILGFPPQRIRDEVPADWMPPRHGTRAVSRPKRPRRVLDKEAILADFRSGWCTLQEVADKHGCTREYVRQVVSRAGENRRTQGTEAPEILNDRLQRFLKALQPGVTSIQAEAISGVSHKEARHAALALGFKPPKHVRAARVRYQEIAQFYEANPHLTGLAVAHHFDVGPNTVSRALRIMGVKPRHSGWRHSSEAVSKYAAKRWPDSQEAA